MGAQAYSGSKKDEHMWASAGAKGGIGSHGEIKQIWTIIMNIGH